MKNLLTISKAFYSILNMTIYFLLFIAAKLYWVRSLVFFIISTYMSQYLLQIVMWISRVTSLDICIFVSKIFVKQIINEAPTIIYIHTFLEMQIKKLWFNIIAAIVKLRVLHCLTPTKVKEKVQAQVFHKLTSLAV